MSHKDVMKAEMHAERLGYGGTGLDNRAFIGGYFCRVLGLPAKSPYYAREYPNAFFAGYRAAKGDQRLFYMTPFIKAGNALAYLARQHARLRSFLRHTYFPRRGYWAGEEHNPNDFK